MRASGVEIVSGLGEEIAASTTIAIKNDTLLPLRDVAEKKELLLASMASLPVKERSRS
jgi:hypothetical protein